MFYYVVTAVSALFLGSIALQTLKPVKKQDYTGQHVIITGGSQGMGKAVAREFVKRGANVTIIARTQATLDSAKSELMSLSKSSQKIQAISVDCTDSQAVVRAFEEVGAPDVIFCCAGMFHPQARSSDGSDLTLGTAHPGLFAELTPEELATPMTGNYISSMYTAHAALKSMLRNPQNTGTQKRKIIFTSSITAFLNISGYTSYTPTKAAIRALADTLRQECLMYDIDVHCVFPATIFSPGFENEQKLKPEITKILEEGDGGQTPEQVAEAALRGLDCGQAMINTEVIGSLLRCNMKGPSPKAGILDIVYGFVASIVLPFVLFDFERKVKTYGAAQRAKEKR